MINRRTIVTKLPAVLRINSRLIASNLGSLSKFDKFRSFEIVNLLEIFKIIANKIFIQTNNKICKEFSIIIKFKIFIGFSEK